jgi:phytoene dehydrogenase-like protein
VANQYDVTIVGGGHNGLVCGAYLAKAGLKTLVLERRHIVGGAAVTEEFTPGLEYGAFDAANSITIRGLSRANFNLNNTGAVGTFFNGVYRSHVLYENHDAYIENSNPSGTGFLDEDQVYFQGALRFALSRLNPAR